MAQTQVIGRVAVKVMPDTSDFRRRAKIDLEKIEKTLDLKVTIQTKLDMSGATKDMLAEVRKINQRNRMMDSRKIRFATTISKDGMNEEITKALRAFSARANNRKLKIKTDLVAATAELELTQESLEKVKHDLRDFAKDNSPIKISVEPEYANASGLATAAKLAVLTRPRTVSILPKINNKAAATVATTLAALSGARALGNILDNLWDKFKNLDKAVPIIGTIAEAMAGLSIMVLNSASNLFALSASLAQIAGAGLALPGIFGGIAIGIGATVAVLKDFNKVLPEVKGLFAELQDQMSEKFWAVAEKPIRSLITNLFPALSAGLKTTANNLGGFFGSLASELEAQLGPRLAPMFDFLNVSIGIAAGATDSLSQSIAILGSIGASYLPQLAGWFVDIADKFNGWLTEAAADGRLKGWIDGGIAALQELARVAGGIGSILSGIATAAQKAGGTSLTTLADSLANVAKVVNGPTFQDTLVGVLTASNKAMQDISTQAGPAFEKFMLKLGQTLPSVFSLAGTAIGDALSGIFDALAQPEVMTGLVDMFAGLQAGIAGIVPALAPVGQALGSLMQVVGTLAANLGPLLGTAFGAIAGVIQTIAPAVMGLINVLGPLLQSVLQAIAPQLQRVAQAFAPLIQKVTELISFIAPVLIPVISFLVKVIADSLIGAINGAINVIDGIIQVIRGLIDFVVGVFTGDWQRAWDGIKQIFSGLWDAIKGIIEVAWNVGVLGAIRKGFTAIKALFDLSGAGLKAGLLAVWNGIKAGVTGFLNAVKALFTGGWAGIKAIFLAALNVVKSYFVGQFNAIKSIVTGAVNALKSIATGGVNGIKAAFDGLKAVVKFVAGVWKSVNDTIANAIVTVVRTVAGLPGKAKQALSNIASVLIGAGASLIQGFINGIKNKFNDVKGTLGDLTSKLTSWKGPPTKDKVLLTPAGKLIIDSFIKGMESRYDAVRKSLSGLTDDVAGTSFDAPSFGRSGRLTAAVDGALGSGGGGGDRVLHYHAAPGSSLDSEEDLFAAAERSRMVNW